MRTKVKQEDKNKDSGKRPRKPLCTRRNGQSVFSRKNNCRTTESLPIVDSETSRIGLMVTGIVTTILWFALVSCIAMSLKVPF